MNTLLSFRANILYSKKEKEKQEDADVYTKFTEIILLCDKPSYKMTNDRDIIRERAIDELRFIVSEKALDALIVQLTEIKNATEQNFLKEK